MPRKKILWLCSWYPNRFEPFNGDFIQRHARAAALYNDIHVIHLAPDTTGNIKDKEININTGIGLTEQIVYYRKKISLFGRITAYYRWLFLYKQAIRNYVVKNGKPDLVHVHVPMKAGILAGWFKKRYKVPFVLTEHWGIYNDIAADKYSLRSRLFKTFTRKIFQEASIFISVSRYLAEGVNQLVIRKKYEVIPNVADAKLFSYKETSSHCFRFIHVSNMVPLKNAEGILRAFADLYSRHKNTELVMVGDTEAAIRQMALSLQLPGGAISFRGEVSYEQVAKEMQAAHCLILFSNIENSPCVIGEALCCGLPVIATNVGGIPELVNETNSLLIPPGDEPMLADAMEKVINNYALYKRVLIAETAVNHFGYETVGQQFDQLYDLALKK